MRITTGSRLLATVSLLSVLLSGTALARPSWVGNIVKVPCWERPDGKILVDRQYLPDDFVPTGRWKVLNTRPNGIDNAWANRVCSLELYQGK